MQKITGWFCLLCGLVQIGVQAGEPLKVLAIGNSFTRNATRHLEELAEAGGHELHLETVIVGGASLEGHVEMLRIRELDPKDEKGLYDGKKSLADYLRAERWDVVTLQQASYMGHDLKSFHPFADELASFIRREGGPCGAPDVA